MNAIEYELNFRGITRLCHFTQSRNLAHIFNDVYGLYSTRTLRKLDMPHNPTDPDRYDGRDDKICCSIQFPNTYYFAKARIQDQLFKDWVVLFIEPSYLWASETMFCPCNAARERGNFIKHGLQGFKSLYEDTSPGIINYRRNQKHLAAAPTDIQAEVLVKEPINLQSIIGIAVVNEEQAQREIFRLKLQGITIDKPFYIVPEFFEKNALTGLIHSGILKREELYSHGVHHDQ